MITLSIENVKNEQKAVAEIRQLLKDIKFVVGQTNIGVDHNLLAGVELTVSSSEGHYLICTSHERDFDLVGLLSATCAADKPKMTRLLNYVHEVLRRHEVSR